MSRTISGLTNDLSSSPLRSLQHTVLSLLCWSHFEAEGGEKGAGPRDEVSHAMPSFYLYRRGQKGDIPNGT